MNFWIGFSLIVMEYESMAKNIGSKCLINKEHRKLIDVEKLQNLNRTKILYQKNEKVD